MKLKFLSLLFLASTAFGVYVPPPYGLSIGGTGQTTQQAALNALVGAVTSGDYVRCNGTNCGPSSLLSADIIGAFTGCSGVQYLGADGACHNAGAGSVTSVSVVSANGMAGTVANAATTPAITLSTTINGVVKGNSTAFSAAVSGTDYSAGTSGLGTGILKSTTGTGALSDAASADVIALFTGCAGTQYLGADGACHNAGAGSVTSVTASSPLLSSGGSTPNITLNSAVTPSFGGSGLTSDTAYAIWAGGTTGTGNYQQLGFGTSGQPLLSNGAGALASYGALNVSTSAITGTGTVSNGMTGVNSLTPYAIIAGGTTSTAVVQQIAGGSTTGQVLTYQGASALPSWTTLASTSPVVAIYYMSGTANSVTSGNQINFDTKETDTNNAVTTGASWKFTAPVAGEYCIGGTANATAGIGNDLTVYKNGTADSYWLTPYASSYAQAGYRCLQLAVNDYIDVRPDGNMTFNGVVSSVKRSHIEIFLIPGSPTTPRCQSTYDSGNGAGSTNTKVRRWTNSRVATGSCYTYADSATLGGSWTINTQGVYTACYADTSSTTGTQIAIVVNGTAGTTNPASLTYAQGLRNQANTGVLGVTQSVCWTGNLNVNDVVWAQEDGSANSTSANSMFTLTQVSN